MAIDFGFGPMGAIPDTLTPDQKRKKVEGVALKTQVPANVLMALDEAGISDHEGAATQIAAAMAQGKPLDAAVADIAGNPDTAKALMSRAYDIADALYPRAAAPEAPKAGGANALRDAPAAIGASVAKAAGGLVYGAGEVAAGAADIANEYLVNPIIEGATGQKDYFPKTNNPLEAPAQVIGGENGLSGYLDSFVSDDVKQDIADFTDPNADLFDTSTWSLGKNPTVRGAIYSAIDVFGSMAPVVITGLVTKSPAAAAAVGGAMSGGFASQDTARAIDQMASTKLPDGRSQLEAESSTYARLIAAGTAPDEALRLTKRRAQQVSAAMAAMPGALGGAATSQIMNGAVGAVAQLPWLGRVAGTAAISGVEEGVQEVAEGMGQRAGLNIGAGMDRSITQGTMNEAMLGAIGGAPMGALGGAFSQREGQTDQQNPPTDGSGGRQAPDIGADAGFAPVSGADQGFGAIRPEAAPTGPISAAAAKAPDLTPQPEVPEAPPVFPDMKAGAELRLKAPDGKIYPAKFQREENGLAVVRIGGSEVTMSPEEFDMAVYTARIDDAQAEAAVTGKPIKTAPTASPDEIFGKVAPQSQQEPDLSRPPVLAGSLAAQAQAKGPAAAPPPVVTGPSNAVEDLAAGIGAAGDGMVDGLYDMMWSSVEKGSTKDASGYSDPILKAAKRVRAIDGNTLTRENFKEFAHAHEAMMKLPPEQRSKVLSDIVAKYTPVAGGKADGETATPEAVPDAAASGGLAGTAQPDPANGSAGDTQPAVETGSGVDRPAAPALPSNEQGGAAELADAKPVEPLKGEVGKKFSAGDELLTTSGRKTTPFPKIDATSDRKTNNTIKRVEKWLMENALAEAEARGDDFNATMFRANLEKPSQSDKDSAEAYLFDDAMSAANMPPAPKITKPLVAEAPAAAPEEKAGTKKADSLRWDNVADTGRIPEGYSVEVQDGDVFGFYGPNRKQFFPTGRTFMADRDPAQHARDVSVMLDRMKQRAAQNADRDLQDEPQGGDILSPNDMAEIDALVGNEIDQAAAEADPNPTPAQAEAGNYKHGHVMWNGLDLTIENAKGSTRSGVAADGQEWSVTMPAHYGYIKRTTGADGEHVDVYIGGTPESDFVMVVDQVDADTKEFDEHKVVLGVKNATEGRTLYEAGFSDGKGAARFGGARKMTVDEFKTWLAEGDLTKPVTNKVKAAAGPKIEDFGQKIGGARKDKAARSIQDLRADRNTATMNLTEAFPEPDYEALAANGVDVDRLAFAAVARATIERKPVAQKYWKISYWVSTVDDRRLIVADLLDGLIDLPTALARIGWSDSSAARVDMVKQFPVDMIAEAAAYKAHPDTTHFSYSTDPATGIRTSVTSKRFGIGRPNDKDYRISATYPTMEDAVSAIKGMIEAERKARAEAGPLKRTRKPVALGIWGGKGNLFYVGFKITDWVQLAGPFATREEAKANLNENRDSLQEEAEVMRDGPAERRTTNSPRVGPDHRTGNVTPEQFQKAFGFRGVEFGNWTTGADRQVRLNEAYDALMDMAGALNIPTEAISLNGALSLAFGARGKGGRNPAAAHYEPSYIVINLTKENGAGSLAHEWWHAVDNHLAKLDAVGSETVAAATGSKSKRRDEYATDRARRSGSLSETEWKALKKLQSALKQPSAPWFLRSQAFDRARTEPYFSTTIELAARGFERVVTDNLQSRGMNNDFLANIDEGAGAYPTTAEARRQGVRDAFNAVLDAISVRLSETGGTKVELPPIDPQLIEDGPQAGFEWEGPTGIKKITARNGNQVTLEVPKREGGGVFVSDWPLDQVEDMIDADQKAMTPEGIAEREAISKAAEIAAKKSADEEALSQKAEDLVSQFIWSIPKAKRGNISDTIRGSYIGLRSGSESVSFYLPKFVHVVRLMDDGWRVSVDYKGKENLKASTGVYYDKVFDKNHLAFAKWYGDRLNEEANAAEAANPDAASEAELAHLFGKDAPDALNAPERMDDAEPEQPAAAQSETPVAAPEADPAPKPAPSGLKGLTDAENEQLAALEAQFLDIFKTQMNSGLDPKLVSVAAQIGALYVKAGTRRFRALIDAMMQRLGLTLEQAQPYARNAYNQIRDDMELAGEDIADMDTSADVIAEVRKMRISAAKAGEKPASQGEAEPATVSQEAQEGAANDQAGSGDASDGVVADRTPESGGALEAGNAPSGSGRDGGDDLGGSAGEYLPAGPDRTPSVGSDGPDVAFPAADANAASAQSGVTPRSGVSQGNYQITDALGLGKGTDGQKIIGNLAAIRLAQKIKSENRFATKDEQDILARYVGWGGLKSVFDVKKDKSTDQWGKAQRELKELLSPAEYLDAFQTVSNAHYTSKPVVDAMWRAMRHFGFKSGRALEPTVGVGNFLGAQPADLAPMTEWFASELDTVTSLIAYHLYPDATILPATGFQDAPFRDGSFDIVIGNPPFGGETIKDRNPARKHLSGMKIHNYIIAKAGMHLRQGGIMSMVVTHRFLDTDNAEARDVLAKGFRFVGAIRLPNDAFRDNAGTDVVTDIIFLQKLAEGQEPDLNASWLDTNGTITVDGKPIRVNRYFQDHPDHILGKSAMDGTMYAKGGKNGTEYTVHGDGRDVAAGIDRILNESMAAEKGILGDRVKALEEAIAAEDTSKMAIGSMAMLDDGRIIRREMNRSISEVTEQSFWGEYAEQWSLAADAIAQIRDNLRATKAPDQDHIDQLLAQQEVAYLKNGKKAAKPTRVEQAFYDVVDAVLRGETTWALDEQLSTIRAYADDKRIGAKRFKTLTGLLSLRRSTLALIRAEYQDSPKIEAMRKALDAQYEAFVAAHGFINSQSVSGLLQGDIGPEIGLEAEYSEALRGDVNGRKVVVEPEFAKKSSILSKRVNFPHKTNFTASTPSEALLISMSERGRVDLAFMAETLGRDAAEIRAELSQGNDPEIFFDPETETWEHAEAYLTGNVRAKMQQAYAAGMTVNGDALKKVQPEPLTSDRITPAIRSQWIPPEVFEDFLADIGLKEVKVSILPQAGMVTATGRESSVLTDYGQQFSNSYKSVIDIFSAAVNGKTLMVSFKDEDGNTRKDEEGTKQVTALIERMGKEFRAWAYLDAARTEAIVTAFNEKMNVFRRREFDGEKYLKLVGANTGAGGFDLRRTQKNGAWRIIQQSSVLLDHVVGAGKTLTLVAGIMERRRLGLSRKPMIAVPNHLVMQWAREFLQLYPAARIMAATPKDFEGANRKRMFARIATGDFDAVIIGHSSLGFIQPPESDQRDVIQDQIEELQQVLDEARRNDESKRTLSQIAKRLQSYEDKLDELSKKKRDDLGFDFAEMGIDYLAVDEAHEFKNLEYNTAQQRLVGMNNPTGSKRAFDLLVKIRGIQKRKGAVHFATGTPVSNSLVEAYSMMKYLDYDEMKAMNLAHFDAWSAAFVEAETRFEYTATQKLKERRVMSRLVNLGVLSQLYRGFADVIDRADLERIYAEQIRAENAKNGTNKSERFPTPKVNGGGRKLLSAPPTEAQKLATDWFVARMAAIKARASDKEYPKIDNALWVLSDARKSSLDIRTLRAASQMDRDENGKVMRASREIKRIYDKWDEQRGTQLVFSDLSTPSKNADKNAEKAIRDLLRVALGEAESKTFYEKIKDLPFMERYEAAAEEAESVAGDPITDEKRQDAIAAWFAENQDAAGLMLTAETGFSVYDDMRKVLIEEMGIPANEIAFIHDYNSADAKARLFKMVNAGQIRVLFGSTPKMGAGTNVQERIVAIHHVDSPWRPSDVEQREGRGIRQGNKLYEADPDNFELEILAYSTTGTSDVVLWQVLERKARSIGTFRQGELDAVDEGEGDADSYAEFMAQSTGNPVFKLKMQAEKDLVELTATTSGALLTRQRAADFVKTFDRVRGDAASNLQYVVATDPASISFTLANGEKVEGDAAEFAEAMTKARETFQTEVDAWDEAFAKTKVRRKQLDEEGKSRSEAMKILKDEGLGSLGDRPQRPSIVSPAITEKSGYARAAKAMLEHVGNMRGEGQAVGNLAGGRLIVTRKQNQLQFGEYFFTVDLQFAGGGKINLATSDAKSPVTSTNLRDAMAPDAIQRAIDGRKSDLNRRIASMDESLPEKKAIAAREIGTEDREAAREAVDYYAVEVKLAEARADFERAQRGDNIFIQSDFKRSLTDVDSSVVTATPTFEFEGEVFEGTGLGAKANEPFSTKKITYYEATRLRNGERVILVAHDVNGKEEPLRIITVPERAKREMAAAKESRFFGRKPVATLTGGELGPWEDMRQLGKNAEAWYRENLIGTSVVNADTGITVQFRREGAKKISGRKGDVLLRIVPALKQILERGQRIAVERDNKGNVDVAAWHTISATVDFEGKPRDVVVKVKETRDGHFHYDLSRDMSDGARHMIASGRDVATAIGLEDNPVDMNLDFSDRDGKSDGAVPVAAMRDITASLNKELAKSGLAGKVYPILVRRLLGESGIEIAGRQQGRKIEVNSMVQDKIGVLRHEILHALRDDALWDKPFGLFTGAEWKTLVAHARANEDIMARVEEAYPNLNTAGQIEEAVAELYREWAQERDTKSEVGKAFDKIRAFFRAIASALRGEGFDDAALIMERIARGKIGGRGPDGPTGGGKKTSPEMRAPSVESAAFKAWFGDSKVVDRKGRPMAVYHGTDANFEAFDATKRGANTRDHDAKMGFFFSSSPEIADGYANLGYGNANIIKTYLSLQNPYVTDMHGTEYNSGLFENIIATAKEDGHDGVILNNVQDGTKIESARSGVFVAFEQGQIKSVFNSGTWDASNPKISEMRLDLLKSKATALVGTGNWRSPSDWLTDAMNGKNGYNTLSLVPSRALFSELGKWSFGAKAYLKAKEAMDALRNEWHARADAVSQAWLKIARKNQKANEAFMELMHLSTIEGIDPSRVDTWEHPFYGVAKASIARLGDEAPDWAKDAVRATERHHASYANLTKLYDALPEDFKAMYRKVRNEYDTLGDDFEKAVIDNIRQGTKIAIKRAERAYQKELDRIRDEGLTGQEKTDAEAEARRMVDAVKARGGWGSDARIGMLRQTFESNRLKGPYFPLARFGDFFVTTRDHTGKVVSFARFESVKDQKAFLAEQEALYPNKVQIGTMSNKSELKAQVDPNFVADVERMLAESGASPEVMDAVWQRWLETLPDQSIRTSKIHRKNQAGFAKDAFRAFGKHMFHGAHQLARLRYGMVMEEHLNDAEDEARKAKDPNRAGLVVNEMRRRHDFTMNPTGAPWVSSLSGLAFIWYLGATPAAALANVSQTTVVGIPILAARFTKAGFSGAMSQIARATKDFANGKGHADKSANLTDKERDAFRQAYKRGTIDKTQAHDLASVAETGIEYNARREKVMRVIGAMFHHTERFNREVTFLASYRLAVADGSAHEEAIDAAADATWKIHMDYQNTSRPRVMQSDIGKLLTVFRNYTVNMLWRLFRDTHQALYGESKEDRAEARTQLIGITLSMMAHAGIKGVWGYGLVMMLLGVFFPGGSDDSEKWLQDALLAEGDSAGVAAWNYIMGMALNGIPGHALQINLTDRVGMPNLWFHGADRDLEGEDLYAHYVGELLGPAIGIGGSVFRGVDLASNGNVWRGLEAATPKVIRDAMKGWRYATDGALTLNGDDLVADVSPWQIIMQVNGFTPAQIAERYDINNRLKNAEKRIVDEKSSIHREVGDVLRAGGVLSAAMIDQINDFNRRYPEYRITGKTIKASINGRIRASQRNESGVSLNSKLNDRLRAGEPPTQYN